MDRYTPSNPTAIENSSRAGLPDVSVIIPTFNRYERLVEAINSIDYASAEIVVVDDGSVPPVADFLEGKTNREFVLIRKENGGVSSARNVGMQHATGRYIAFLDSDDQFVPAKLERLIKALENQPDVDFVFHDIARRTTRKGGTATPLEQLHSEIFPAMRTAAKKSKRLDKDSYLIPSIDVFRNLTSGTPIFPSSVVLRRRVTERIAPWTERFGLCEDMDYFARALLHTDAIFLDLPLTVMGIGEDNLSKDKMQTLHSDISVLKSLGQSRFEGQHAEVLKESTCRRLQALGWHHKKAGHYRAAGMAYRDSLRYKPNLKSLVNYLLLLPKFLVHRDRLSPSQS